MVEFTEKVHEKCQAFGDRIIKLNDYLLQLEVKQEELRAKKESYCFEGGKREPLLD